MSAALDEDLRRAASRVRSALTGQWLCDSLSRHAAGPGGGLSSGRPLGGCGLDASKFLSNFIGAAFTARDRNPKDVRRLEEGRLEAVTSCYSEVASAGAVDLVAPRGKRPTRRALAQASAGAAPRQLWAAREETRSCAGEGAAGSGKSIGSEESGQDRRGEVAPDSSQHPGSFLSSRCAPDGATRVDGSEDPGSTGNSFGRILASFASMGRARRRAALPLALLGGLGLGKGKPRDDRAASEAEFQQRALAAALASGKRATVLGFYSPKCRLCRSLWGLLGDVERHHGAWLNVVKADAENERWLPEVAHYDVNYVPCFVLLDSHGNALAKTGVPLTRDHAVAGLRYLVESMRPMAAARHLDAAPPAGPQAPAGRGPRRAPAKRLPSGPRS